MTEEIQQLTDLISGLHGICKEQNMQIGILNEKIERLETQRAWPFKKIDKLTERVEYLERMRELEKV